MAGEMAAESLAGMPAASVSERASSSRSAIHVSTMRAAPAAPATNRRWAAVNVVERRSDTCTAMPINNATPIPPAPTTATERVRPSARLAESLAPDAHQSTDLVGGRPLGACLEAVETIEELSLLPREILLESAIDDYAHQLVVRELLGLGAVAACDAFGHCPG